MPGPSTPVGAALREWRDALVRDLGGPDVTGERHDVDLSSKAVAVLRAHLTRWKAEKLRRGWRETPPALFCSTAGTYTDPSGVRQAFRRVCP
jgi:hypothetical protein